MAYKRFALLPLFLASVFCSDPVQLHPEEQCMLIRELQGHWHKEFKYRYELQNNATDYLLMSNEELKEALRHGRYKEENSRILDFAYYEVWDPRKHFPKAAEFWFDDFWLQVNQSNLLGCGRKDYEDSKAFYYEGDGVQVEETKRSSEGYRGANRFSEEDIKYYSSVGILVCFLK